MVGKLLPTALLLNGAAAFPHIAELVAANNKRQVGLPTGLVDFPEFPGVPGHGDFKIFDPEVQRVSVSGDHEFRMPGPGDVRGPCAGLNAAANHGYLPRNGIADAESINTGLWEAFGLDKTATLFLQTATMFFNGDPISGRWSIGPHDTRTSSLGPLDGLLGNETGICAYGHLRTEADASITRGDWLAPEMNSNCISYPTFMQELFDLSDQMGDGMLTARVMAQHSSNRKKHSIATNPNYFAPVYPGVAFTFGAHMFANVLLSNHSAEHPTGFLNKDVFMQFFGYTRDSSGALQYTFGSERIPENWYKRHDLDAWTLADILASTAQQCVSYPSNCQVGGNLGTVNSFVGVDPGDISGGLLNGAEDLQDPAKLGCFISQTIQGDTPSFLRGALSGVLLDQALGMVQTKLLPALAGLGACPNMPKGRTQGEWDSKYPGANSPSSGPRDLYGN